MTSRAASLCATWALLALAATALGHPEGFSGFHVDVLGDRAHVVLTVHTRDTTAWFPPGKFPDYVKQVCAALAADPNDVIELSFDGDAPATPTNVKAFQADVGLLQFEADYPIPAGAQTMQIWSKHVMRLPSGHQQLLYVMAGSQTLLEDTLERGHESVIVELPRNRTTTTQSSSSQPLATSPAAVHRTSFFLLGIEHIVTGYDHLLFLAALLLVCRTFKEAAGVITFFTVAHSITLTLAALDIVRMPARIVEPAIAASIVYVGLENIFGKHRVLWRAGITFAFGLVHGLGFASALREVGLGTQGVGLAMPLLKFSIGLETGQLTIAAVLLSVLLRLRHWRGYERRFMPIGSILVSAIGMYWLVTRLIQG